jgi:hypothetical protein
VGLSMLTVPLGVRAGAALRAFEGAAWRLRWLSPATLALSFAALAAMRLL